MEFTLLGIVAGVISGIISGIITLLLVISVINLSVDEEDKEFVTKRKKRKLQSQKGGIIETTVLIDN